MFTCPVCKAVLAGTRPVACGCGHEVPLIALIYQFCDDPPISLDQERRRYLGYDGVGENYDDPVYARQVNATENYGIFGACSQKLVDLLGKGCVVLDIGAGLPSDFTDKNPMALEVLRTGVMIV